METKTDLIMVRNKEKKYFQIEKNIPINDRSTAKGKLKALLASMEIGDSFVSPRIIALTQYGILLKRQFTYRSFKKESKKLFRIWRIK